MILSSHCPGESIGLEFNPSEPDLFRVISNQSEKRFGYRFLKNGQISIRLNLIHSYSIRGTIRINSDLSERSFRSKLGLIETEFLIRLKPIFRFGFIRIEASY